MVKKINEILDEVISTPANEAQLKLAQNIEINAQVALEQHALNATQSGDHGKAGEFHKALLLLTQLKIALADAALDVKTTVENILKSKKVL